MSKGRRSFTVHIHPSVPGRKRPTAKFIMNALLADCGVPWTVIPVARRDDYMEALEEASQHKNIVSLTMFVSGLVNAPQAGKRGEHRAKRQVGGGIALP